MLFGCEESAFFYMLVALSVVLVMRWTWWAEYRKW